MVVPTGSRPAGRWAWLENSEVKYSEELEEFLDQASTQLDEQKESRGHVVDILIKIGNKLKELGVCEAAVVTVMKGMKSYHNVTHLRCADMAKTIFKQEDSKTSPVDKVVGARKAKTEGKSSPIDMEAGRQALLSGLGPQSQAPKAKSKVEGGEQLPEGWSQLWDPSTGQPYFWKPEDPAGTLTWERPGGGGPIAQTKWQQAAPEEHSWWGDQADQRCVWPARKDLEHSMSTEQ